MFSGLTCWVYTHTYKGYFNRVVAEFMVIKPVKRALRFSNILHTHVIHSYCHSSLRNYSN